MPLCVCVCVCISRVMSLGVYVCPSLRLYASVCFLFPFIFDIFIFVFLFFQIVTDEQTDLGILAHPLLSLILASDDAFQAVSTAFVKKQTV